MPREPGSPESRPDTTSYTSAPPFVYVEEFDQVFGVESVEEIPKERLATPEPPAPVVVSSSAVISPRSFFQVFRRVETLAVRLIPMPRIGQGMVFHPAVPTTVLGSLAWIVVSFIFQLLF